MSACFKCQPQDEVLDKYPTTTTFTFSHLQFQLCQPCYVEVERILVPFRVDRESLWIQEQRYWASFKGKICPRQVSMDETMEAAQSNHHEGISVVLSWLGKEVDNSYLVEKYKRNKDGD